MRRDHEHFDVRTRPAIENAVGKARYSIPPNTGRKFDAIPVRIFTDLDHRSLESRKITRAQADALRFVVGDVLKMLNARHLNEEVTHFSNA